MNIEGKEGKKGGYLRYVNLIKLLTKGSRKKKKIFLMAGPLRRREGGTLVQGRPLRGKKTFLTEKSFDGH